MFLQDRSTQPEYLDAPERTAAELEHHYTWLNRINRLSRFERPFRIWIPRFLAEPECRRLEVLDVGAGEGSLGRCLNRWAGERGWDWLFTDLDSSQTVRSLNPSRRAVLGSATALPFEDGRFDVVIANTMTHHLDSEDAVVAHFREAARVARRLVLICDMQRRLPFFLLLGISLWMVRAPREFRRDGLLSVRRGWRTREWRRLADAAGLPEAQVWAEHGSRVLLALVKPPGQPRRAR
jgi:Methyltransferase domain